jgi:Tfp pilus assembly protein PilO
MTENNLSKQNFINTLLNTYFNLFVVIFVSLLLLISYFLILKPKVDTTTAAIAENISSHQKVLQAETAKLTSLKAAVASYESINKDDSERINKILPDDYDKEMLFGELDEIVAKNGFILNSISLTKQESNDPKLGKLGVINVSLGIASVDYNGLKNLLNFLESNLRVLDVKNLSLSGGSSGNIELSTYYFKK